MGIESESTTASILKVRHDAIHEALLRGVTSDAALTQIANKAELLYTDEIGRESEMRFDEYVQLTKFVENVSIARKIEDVFLGIDRWITFDKSLRLPPLPVQIKSSFEGVNRFMYGCEEEGVEPDPIFQHLYGIMVVINSGPHVTFRGFRTNLLSEVNRIQKIIDEKRYPPGIYLK